MLITHLTETLKKVAGELLSRDDVKSLIDNLKTQAPAVVEELIPGQMSVGQVQRILSAVQDWVAGAKLLGAGGGGFFLMLAKDETAAARIRQSLGGSPPNARARFVDFNLSESGLQLTRS